MPLHWYPGISLWVYIVMVYIVVYFILLIFILSVSYIVNIEPSQASNAYGTIYVTQTAFSDTVMVHGQISNLPKGNYIMEVQSLRLHENNCHDTEERSNSNEEPLPDNIYKVSILTC